MHLRRFVVLCIIAIGLWNSLAAQTTCSGTITGPNGKQLPAAHVDLLTAEQDSVVQRVIALPNGEYRIPVPHRGFWVLRYVGVGYEEHRLVLYVPSNAPMKIDIGLGCHHYLPGEPGLSVVGDFNLWNVVTAVPLKRDDDGTFRATFSVTKDSIEFRIRGYRDGDGIEGIKDAKFILHQDGKYNALIPAPGGTARIVVNPHLLDRSGSHAQTNFVDAPERTRKIAAAIDEWWEGEQNNFAAQADKAMGRAPLDTPVVEWGTLVANLLREENRERDSLVASVLALAHLSTGIGLRRRDAGSLTKSLERLSPTSVVWILNPGAMSIAVRSSTWPKARQMSYLETAIRKHPERTVRVAVLFSEFQIADAADSDPNAARYYKLLTGEYADTPQGKKARKDFPPPDPSSKP